ncbi:MAG: hypothetical protein WC560_07210 [Syntrophales bacterium]
MIAYECKTFTEILGYSQTYQWYAGQPFEYPITDRTFKTEKMFLSAYKGFSNCQARFGIGGSITKWKNENYIGYEGHFVHNITKDRKEVTRLIFNIAGGKRPVDEWKSDIEDVLEVLLKKYPNLQELYLQAVIGGFDDNSNIRAVINHPRIVEAINAVVNNSSHGLLRCGAVVKLKSEGFSDTRGHLTSNAAQKSKELMLKFYDIST